MSALSSYRVLDLTSQRGWLCGKILADLGADVIKVEPPGGDPGRLGPPFAGDLPNPESSLRWWFCNRGKRSVTLELESGEGRETLLRIAAQADAVVESFAPGRMAELGLAYDDLASVNPRLVYTSVTPFGQTGPYATFEGPDIVLAATGGVMYVHGDPDRPPIRISVPQYELHGAAEAAAWTTFALYHASATGEGQHIDVSCQLAAIRTLMTAPAYASVEGRELHRHGDTTRNGLRMIHPCADGHVTAMLSAAFGGRKFMGWAASQVEVPDWLADFDWEGTDFVEMSRGEEGPTFWKAVGDVLTEFFATKTKAELYDVALREGYLIAPVNTLADVRDDEQLAARNYFHEVDGLIHAGPWARLSATPLVDTLRAPRVGEHTDEVLAALEKPPTVEPSRQRQPSSSPSARTDIFAGLKVLDMSWVGVGPMTTRYLADLGATVVRLESQKRVDVLRALPPFSEQRPGLNRSQFWADFNASKVGLGVDMTNPAGREVARRLARWADVLVESFTPGTMTGWQMSYNDLSKDNPGLVMLSTCMQGQTGPHSSYRGFGQLIASLGGFYELHGWPDRPPTPIGAFTDTVCQRFAAATIVAALDHRRHSGTGQHIDLSQYEVGLQFLGTELLDLEVNGRIATRDGNRSRSACPHGAFPSAGDDRWVVIAVETDDQWQTLRKVAGWDDDPELATFEGRKAREDEVEKLVSTWTSTLEPREVVERLQPRVPAGAVNRLSELHTDPQVIHRGYFVEVQGHPDIGTAAYEGFQAILSRTPARIRKPAPCLGEDSVGVLQNILGMSEDEIGDLLAAEAIEITGGDP